MTYLRLPGSQDAQPGCVTILKEELKHACWHCIFVGGTGLSRCETLKCSKAFTFHGMRRLLHSSRSRKFLAHWLLLCVSGGRKAKMEFMFLYLSSQRLYYLVCFCRPLPNNKIPCYHSPRTEWRYKAAMSDSNFCAKKWGGVALKPQDSCTGIRFPYG